PRARLAREPLSRDPGRLSECLERLFHLALLFEELRQVEEKRRGAFPLRCLEELPANSQALPESANRFVRAVFHSVQAPEALQRGGERVLVQRVGGARYQITGDGESSFQLKAG